MLKAPGRLGRAFLSIVLTLVLFSCGTARTFDNRGEDALDSPTAVVRTASSTDARPARAGHADANA